MSFRNSFRYVPPQRKDTPINPAAYHENLDRVCDNIQSVLDYANSFLIPDCEEALEESIKICKEMQKHLAAQFPNTDNHDKTDKDPR